jgi:hypothetical protein
VPPLVTDINLSLDDRFLYVSCWGTGEFIQYDVSDPANLKKTGSVHLGGMCAARLIPTIRGRSTAARRWLITRWQATISPLALFPGRADLIPMG